MHDQRPKTESKKSRFGCQSLAENAGLHQTCVELIESGCGQSQARRGDGRTQAVDAVGAGGATSLT